MLNTSFPVLESFSVVLVMDLVSVLICLVRVSLVLDSFSVVLVIDLVNTLSVIGLVSIVLVTCLVSVKQHHPSFGNVFGNCCHSEFHECFRAIKFFSIDP